MSPTTNFQVERIPFLDGGLVTSVSPRLIDQSRGICTDILNIDFSKPGIPSKRPGTESLYTAITDETVNSIFEYLKTSTGARHLLVGTEEGNLYVWDEEEWTPLATGLDGSPLWFINFADRVVMGNGEDPVMSWDGTTLEENLGRDTAEMETFFPYGNNDLVFTAVATGASGNNIQVEFVYPDVDTATPSVVVTGAGTSSSPYIITVTLAYTVKVPHIEAIFLDSPTGGTYELGNIFEKKVFAYDATAADIEAGLKTIYGSNIIDSVVTSAEAGEDFIVTFTTSIINPYLRASFTELEYAESGSPELIENQAFAWDEVLSTAADIKTLLNGTPAVAAIITTEHLSGSDGTNTVTTLTKRSLSGGYDTPVGKYLTMFKNRILMIGDDDLLLSSHTGDPTLWNPNDPASNSFLAYIGTNDGTTITGLLDLGDGGLLIGKSNSLYGMFGYTRENFVVDLIDTAVGVVSHKTMQYIKPYALFVARDGIYRYEIGGIPERVSDAIRDIFDEQVDHDNIADSSACIYNRTYVLTLPRVGGGTINLVYYPQEGRWTKWDKPNSFITAPYLDFENKIVFVEDNQVKLTTHSVSLDDNAAMEVTYTTLELDAGYPEVDKYYGDLYLIFRTAEEPYEATVEISFNGDEFFIAANKEIIEGTQDKQKVLRVVLGREARFMEVRITNEDKNRHFSPIALNYTCKVQEVL
jgi:hypothetical protein